MAKCIYSEFLVSGTEQTQAHTNRKLRRISVTNRMHVAARPTAEATSTRSAINMHVRAVPDSGTAPAHPPEPVPQPLLPPPDALDCLPPAAYRRRPPPCAHAGGPTASYRPAHPSWPARVPNRMKKLSHLHTWHGRACTCSASSRLGRVREHRSLAALHPHVTIATGRWRSQLADPAALATGGPAAVRQDD